MIEDFFSRALIGGLGVALVAGPLGCFIVWRRMAYFGAAMSHSALLGVALSFLVGVEPIIGVLALGWVIAPTLLALERRASVASDTLLAIIAHGSIAVGLVLIAIMTWLRIDLMAFLFGDVLAVSPRDLAVIYLGGGIVLGVFALIWRPLLAATVSEELASVAALGPGRALLVYMLLVAAVIAIAMKIVGVLLIVSLLIIPPATVRRLSRTPEEMAVFAAVAGTLAVVLGLFASLQFDTPSGPSIVVVTLILFLVSLVVPSRRQPAPTRPTREQAR